VPFQPTQYKSPENSKEHNKNLKILVTGGTGFIGSHVVDRFVRGGHEVEEGDAANSECEYGVSKRTVEHYPYLSPVAQTQLRGMCWIDSPFGVSLFCILRKHPCPE
jgi:hypothetical protein